MYVQVPGLVPPDKIEGQPVLKLRSPLDIEWSTYDSGDRALPKQLKKGIIEGKGEDPSSYRGASRALARASSSPSLNLLEEGAENMDSFIPSPLRSGAPLFSSLVNNRRLPLLIELALDRIS